MTDKEKCQLLVEFGRSACEGKNGWSCSSCPLYPKMCTSRTVYDLALEWLEEDNDKNEGEDLEYTVTLGKMGDMQYIKRKAGDTLIVGELKYSNYIDKYDTHAEICPICGGKGTVSSSRFCSTTSSLAEVICHGCEGRGWIVVPNSL